MSDPMSVLLREGERVSAHDVDAAANDTDAMYDELFETMRAEGQIPPADIDHALESTSGNLNSYDERQSSSVPIPPSLADIASQVKPLDFAFEDPAIGVEYDLHREDRGEMGGKRKKPLTERAGWNEMDEKGNMPKKPRGKRGPRDVITETYAAYSQPSSSRSQTGLRQGEESQDGVGDMNEGANTLANDLADVTREMDLAQSALADVLGQSAEAIGADDGMGGSEEGDQPGGGPVDERGQKPNKGQRAVQNRKAQQVYRRKREEKMKLLQAEADALLPTREALYKSYEQIKKVALEYDSAKIQLSALQATLLSLNQQGVSILTNQYNFPMDPNNLKDSESMRPGPISQGDVDKAFKQLERQSMELALSRRSS